MLKNITMGQYVDTDSILHRLDPRTKIILLFCYLVVLFTMSSPISYIAIGIFSVVIIFLSDVPFKYVLGGIKPILFILIFTSVINLFLTPGEKILSFGKVGITLSGIKMALMLCFRLILLVMVSSLLTLTTSPMKLTDGIERLLRPLSKIGVPSSEIAMMMTIAIRFIPTLSEEADKIIKAQTARGADFESGGLIKKGKAMVPLIVPLFVSAFRRADDLAVAMDARCYHGGEKRTRMNEIKFTKRDFFAFLICILFFLVVIAIEIF